MKRTSAKETITYNLESEIATLSQSESGASELRLTRGAWGDNPVKYDLRYWVIKDGQERPAKGMTLSDEEALKLKEALDQTFTKATLKKNTTGVKTKERKTSASKV